jgi:hypothetical protein
MKSALILIGLLLFGQEPSLKPNMSAPKAEAPMVLSLEIDFNNTLPPAYISVRGPDTKPRWIWAPRFARIPGFPRRPDELPIQAIRVESQFNGETADVKVSLLRGHKGFEREDPVANYHIGLEQKTTVTELKSFGLEPIDLRLFQTVPPLPPSPAFENLTKTVEIVSVRSDNIPLPAYHLTVRNLSDKNIRAVKIEVINDNRPRLSALWQAELDRPLMEPGGTLERIVPVVTSQLIGSRYEPGAATSSTIRILSAVFEDLTYDGEEDPACDYEKFVIGRRLWVTRMLPFIEQQLANTELSPQDFKQKFQSLTFELDEGEKTGKSSVSEKCGNPDSFTDISTQNLTLELNRELERIIKTRPAPPISFRGWLESRCDEYKSWLVRLK